VLSRALIVTSVALAVVGFLFIHGYSPRGGPLWFAIHGKIWLNAACAAGHSPDNPFSEFTSDLPWPPLWQCGAILPYRWILTGCVTVLALGALLEWRRRP